MNRLIPGDQMKRSHSRPPTPGPFTSSVKTAIFFAVLALLTALVAWLDPRPSLRHVQVAMSSGASTGNYFATVQKIAAEAERRKGRVFNLSSAGSVENVRRLIDGAKDCKVHFALVQN